MGTDGRSSVPQRTGAPVTTLALTLVAFQSASGLVQPQLPDSGDTCLRVSREQVSFSLEPPHACLAVSFHRLALEHAASGHSGTVIWDSLALLGGALVVVPEDQRVLGEMSRPQPLDPSSRAKQKPRPCTGPGQPGAHPGGRTPHTRGGCQSRA